MNPQVVLLAAGKSTRVWPLSEKIFFEFLGKTVLEHQIITLLNSGLQDICVVGNEENLPRIQDICASLQGKFTFATQQDLSMGQRGGILAAAEKIDHQKPVLVVCSNDIVDKKAILDTLYQAKNTDSEVYFVGKKVDKYFPGGYLSVNGDNQITGIVEKPKPGTEPSDLVTLLIHLYQKPSALFEKLNAWPSDDGYEEVLQQLFDDGVTAEAVPYNGFWQAIKYPWHLLDVGQYMISNISTQSIHPTAKISKTAIIKGNVIIEEGVKIFDYAVIVGPAFIGRDSVVANHALVRESHISAQCVVGQGTEIARSVLQSKCWTHRNYVGDSIFDRNVSLGSGTVTGNFRLDEGEISSMVKKEKVSTQRNKFGAAIGRNVRFGINSSIMPGVKIGSGSFIGAGLTLEKDVNEKQFTFKETALVSKENTKEITEREDF
jgi:bifunctional UDP-N-acetylglucosamine pyrophosphorylase/glucosamine-1-phosphate N-acetyltransferase